MLFTVAIPLYNKGGYIETTIRSVLNQTFSDFEVVVVDDGSKDGGAAAVMEINDPRVRLVVQQNAGVSVARNRAIAEARGRWVAFLDADDWWHPDYLAEQQRSIGQHPDALVVTTAFLTKRDSADWLPRPWPVPAGDLERRLLTELPHYFKKDVPFFTGSVAVQTALLRTLQPCFMPGETLGEDIELWFRLGELGAIVHLNFPLVAYRDAAGESLSSLHRFDDLPSYVSRLKTRALSGALDRQQADAVFSLVAFQQITLARKSLVNGRRLKALRWLSRAGARSLLEKRWWLTFSMAVLVPRTAILKWNALRWRRAVVRKNKGISQPGS